MQNNLAIALNPREIEVQQRKLITKRKHSFLTAVKDSTIDLETLLTSIDQHSLEDQKRSSLMNRIDTKYVLPATMLPIILSVLSDEYTVLSENNKQIFNYETTYFDTKKREFYLAHHNGKLNRYKVRYRRYVESNRSYMEVKFKNNKGRTIKDRISLNQISPAQTEINQFINLCLEKKFSPLEKSLHVNYKRITLMNKYRQERLTIDIDIGFQSENNGNIRTLPNIIIAELKRETNNDASYFSKLVKSYNHAPLSFSKYCMGCALTGESNLKSNRFKPLISQLNKILNNTIGQTES